MPAAVQEGMLLSLLLSLALASPPDDAVAAAKTWLGTPYAWGGRGTAKNPGMDCLGVLYRAYGQATGTPWTRYPVNPSDLVAGGLLGQPVPGLRGTLRLDVELQQLQPGDVLYFLMANYEIKDDPLLTIGPTKYWPWHTGMYLGDGVALHAEPGGVVRTQPLMEIAWDALFVTRLPADR